MMKRKVIIIGSICLIMVIIIGILSVIGINNFTQQDQEKRRFEIFHIGEKIRTGEELILFIEGAPKNAVILWDLGDGNISRGERINISYEKSDFYNVTVSVITKTIMGYGNTTIPIYNEDRHHIRSGDSFRELRLFLYRGVGTGSPVYSGLSKPDVSVRVNINDAVGGFQIYVNIRNLDDGDPFNENIDMEDYSARLTDINYEKAFDPSLFPPSNRTYELTIGILYDNAMSGAWEIEFWINF